MAENDRELWLTELLDDAANQYEPDAERLKAMVAARIAQRNDEAQAPQRLPVRRALSRHEPRSRTARGRRLGLIGRLGLAGIPASVALSTIGAAAALAVGATATIAVTSSHNHHTVTVAVSGSTGSQSPTPGESGGPTTPRASEPPATSSALATTSSDGSSTTGTTTSSRLVSAVPSIDHGSFSYWAQLDLPVTAKQAITALVLTVTVAKCQGLTATGSWDTGASGQFTDTTKTESDGSITYKFELNPGRSINPGTVTFAVQFNHASSGWNAALDTYNVSARTASSTKVSSVNGAY